MPEKAWNFNSIEVYVLRLVFHFQIISNFNYLSISLPHVSTKSMIVLSHMFILKKTTFLISTYSHCTYYKSSLLFCLRITKLLFINPSEYAKSRSGVQLRWLLQCWRMAVQSISFPYASVKADNFHFVQCMFLFIIT